MKPHITTGQGSYQRRITLRADPINYRQIAFVAAMTIGIGGLILLAIAAAVMP